MMIKKLLLLTFILVTTSIVAQLTLPYKLINNSEYNNQEVYIGLVARFGNDDVWMNLNDGALKVMSAEDNTVKGPEWSVPTDWLYPDIFTKLSDIDNQTINIPHGLYGCRIFISFESPMYLHFHETGGYAGANLSWDADPNNGIRWELVELSWGNSGLWTNTSRVDAYQYPIAVEVNGFQGDVGLPTYAENYERAVSGEGKVKYGIIGEKIGHEQIMNLWDSYVDPEYLICKEVALHSIDGKPVIHQPTKVAGFPENTLDTYIDEIWSVYADQDLVIDIGDRGIWTGRVENQQFNFVDPADGSIATIYGKPSSLDAMEGAGFLASTPISSSTNEEKHNEDLMIQAQICAAITRHAIYTDITGPTVQYTHDGSRYFTRNPHNQYVSFFHQENITYDSKTYAFAYDDVGDHSATIQTTFPTQVRVIIGGYEGYESAEPELLTMTVSPDITEMIVGETQQFYATGYDQFSDIFNVNVTWSTSTGATINSSGVFTTPTAGEYTITATDGSISRTVHVSVIEEEPIILSGCEAIAETGDYSYQVTNNGPNPSITFTPTVTGTGDNLCLLFYGTDPNATFGATNVQPNTPFEINAEAGEIVYFYYTYNTASGNIKDTSGARHTFLVGDCSNINPTEENNPSPSQNCGGTASNGQYSYEFIGEGDNPTLTFIPSTVGNGDNLCLLFYGTDPNKTFGATSVTPNVPFELKAAVNETIYFYYTYSLASGGENNTAGSPHSFTIGQCSEDLPTDDETVSFCEGNASTGDYTFQVSDKANNPSLTFIPSSEGNGDQLCLLFYGTDPNTPFGATGVEPNVPFEINANEGETVYFYYTYSLASGGENNTAANKHSFTVGDCENSVYTPLTQQTKEIIKVSNPINTPVVQISGLPDVSTIELYNFNGLLIKQITVSGSYKELNTSTLKQGIYILKIKTPQNISTQKIVVQ